MNQISELTNLFKDNVILTTFISMYGIGVVTYLFRNIPTKLFYSIKKQITTTISIANFNISYDLFMKELLRNSKLYTIRSLRVSNGKWGDSSLTTTIGFGYHFIFYKKKLLFLSIMEKESKSFEEKVTLQITKFGRSHSFFNELIQTVKKLDIGDPNEIKVYNYDPCHWEFITSIPKREMNSIFIPNESKKEVLNALDKFANNESFYKERGIPYQLGILLEGPPGTGKTSLVKAIASYINKNISTISPTHLYDLPRSLGSFKESSIMVIEDIDTSIITNDRKTKNVLSEEDLTQGKMLKEEDELVFSFSSLSDVLNSIDGILSIHGRVLIMTTNHYEKLDKALIRPGRVDLVIHVGFVTQETFNDFILSFFNKKVNRKFTGKEVTISKLQNEFLLGNDYDYFIEKYCEQEE